MSCSSPFKSSGAILLVEALPEASAVADLLSNYAVMRDQAPAAL